MMTLTHSSRHSDQKILPSRDALMELTEIRTSGIVSQGAQRSSCDAAASLEGLASAIDNEILVNLCKTFSKQERMVLTQCIWELQALCPRRSRS